MKVLKSDVNKPMFKFGETVKHGKTGKLYVILTQPSELHILEYCNLPFYSYTEKHGVPFKVWYRAQTIMEDGRFIKL